MTVILGYDADVITMSGGVGRSSDDVLLKIVSGAIRHLWRWSVGPIIMASSKNFNLFNKLGLILPDLGLKAKFNQNLGAFAYTFIHFVICEQRFKIYTILPNFKLFPEDSPREINIPGSNPTKLVCDYPEPTSERGLIK